MIQGSEEWLAARCGKVTASRVSAVMSKGKGNAPSATRKNYMAELVTERLTGLPAPGFDNDAMKWGRETEPQAASFYSFTKDIELVEVGFVDHPKVASFGASPDRLIGDDGLVEIKCPNTATHIATLTGSSPIKREYMIQMQVQMACTGRDWCDFVSFDPRLPVELQMHVTRIERDAGHIAEIESAVRCFLSELDDMETRLRGMMMAEAA